MKSNLQFKPTKTWQLIVAWAVFVAALIAAYYLIATFKTNWMITGVALLGITAAIAVYTTDEWAKKFKPPTT